jgi:ankyrin repeat protein
VKMLMDSNSDPAERDNCGRTALHYAVYSGKVEILTILT